MSFPVTRHAVANATTSHAVVSTTVAYPVRFDDIEDAGGLEQPSNIVTIDIATPALITWPTNHTFTLGDVVWFTTTGALPTGITAATPYYVQSAGLTATQFRISASLGGADVNTSGTQSGIQTCRCINQLHFPTRGDYLVELSWMVRLNTAVDATMDLWADFNGSNVANSNTQLRLTANGEVNVASCPYVFTATAPNDFCRFFYRGSDTNLELLAVGTAASPTRPATPAVVLTAVYVGRHIA